MRWVPTTPVHDPLTWAYRLMRSEVIHRRLQRVCPHPEHRVFEFEDLLRSGIFCDDCQAVLVRVRVPFRLRGDRVRAWR